MMIYYDENKQTVGPILTNKHLKNISTGKIGKEGKIMKIAVITGASSGIGRATAEKLLALGYRVVAADRDESRLAKTRNDLAECYRGTLTTRQVDVADEKSVAELAEFVKKEFGACHALVNCAGVFRGGLLHESVSADFDIQMDVNVRGMYHTMKYLVPVMLESETAAVVNLASLSGINGDYNAPLYCASKSAVIGLSRAAALDYAGNGLRINVVSPSATATPMFLNGSSETVISAFRAAIPDHKIGLPSQVADAIAFLVSDESVHITGQNLSVDGGLAAWNGQPKQDKEE